ncbi:hypothetical protein CBER1_06022 [Cercospora berteroae]|uniref:RING-type domain-containing protein n=1 Tax=Cercospora berteroae TaxID=357750 RepID=A0A2S6C584_9PEZI|nr:hypothetical protein CBER1_06022 [Cercospora berteroae]
MTTPRSRSLAQLKALTARRGLSLDGLRLKQHFIDALHAADAKASSSTQASTTNSGLSREETPKAQSPNGQVKSTNSSAPLQNRDPNTTNTNMAGGKRKRDELADPTGSDDDDRNASTRKTLRVTEQTRAPAIASSSTSHAPRYPSGPASAFPLPTAFGNSQHDEGERDDWLADDAAFNDIVGSSQDDAIGSEDMHLYGDLDTKIVGCQYYRGYSNRGEHVLLKREPGNPYDSNAIRVDSVAHTQIGHIPRRIAEKLAKYIDNRSLRAEAQLTGNIGTYDCPIVLPLKALKEAERAAKQREKERKQAEAARLAEARRAAAAGKRAQVNSQGEFTNPGSSGDGDPSQPDMSAIQEASQRIDPRRMANEAGKLGMSEEQLQQMPMAEQPDRVKTTMLPYQLQALQWLLDQENPQPPTATGQSTQLWTRVDNSRYTNIATNFSTRSEPKLASGGILADDMGLGKTIQMLALVAADAKLHGKGTTLIVAPLSVLSNWSGQASFHFKDGHQLDTYIYHGAGRVKMSTKDFAQYDLVITTYGTLASDFASGPTKTSERKLRATGLYSHEWRRVVLDEGHNIRNPQTKAAAAANALIARSRWVLTGTPIVNSLKDLYSLLRFVGITGGLEQLDIFSSVLVRPLKLGTRDSSLLLQAIMRAFTLRRRKDMRFIDLKLPELKEFVHRLQFSKEEQQKYDALDGEARGVLKAYEKKAGSGQVTYNHLLEILLRMRQVCNHWKLASQRVADLMAQLEKQKTGTLTPETISTLQQVLQVQIDSSEDCAICLETLHSPVITNCGHAFGRDCIVKVIEGQHKCPFCRAELKDEQCLVEPSNEFGDGSDNENGSGDEGNSSKVDGLLRILGAVTNGEKTIIFSQWKSFLDLLEEPLKQAGFKFCRIDGTMSAQRRDQALNALNNDGETTILLATLGVCAVGLNLTVANNVILCDTWWAPAIEDQAVDRVHRLGQTKECSVFRLVMDKTIEEKTLSIQEDKRKLMMLAFSEQKNKRMALRTNRLADIQRLLS